MKGAHFSIQRNTYRHHALFNQCGLSLIELMIALSIGLLMLIGILSLVVNVSRTRVELDKTSEQIENGRYAMQKLVDDIRLAGFFGASQLISAQKSSPDPCADAGTLSDLQFSYSSSGTLPGITSPLPIEGYAAGATLPTCLTDAAAGTEVLMLRRVETSEVAVSAIGASNAKPYLQISACSTDPVPIVFAKTAASFTLKQKDCATTATLWPYLTRAYFLSGCNDCSASDDIPTLKVLEMVNGSLQINDVAEGVEDIHFAYGLDFDQNGSPDCYTDDPAAAGAPADCPAASWGTPAQNWANVTAVHVHLLARSVEASADWDDNRTYDLGRATRSGPFNDHFKRQVYSAVIVIPNISGSRE